ncbi:MAG: ABC transporter ATP-binding protein, partial [Aggregatilineales bacterium]
TAILGPTGCGKTTLLRMIAGLETPDEGEVYYDDIPLHQTRIEDRGIGMVFQEYALLPHRESSYSVGFFLRLRKREHEVPQRVHDVSKITGFGLDALMDKFPKHLSGGEKQRVAIARAFARDLKLLLLDEPFANLDAKFRSESRIELQRLLRHFPITTVLVTHDQIEAASLSDRVILMRDGHIEQVGNYHHLYDDPANHFVAEFIGTPITNSFAGRIENGIWQGRQFGGFTVPTGIADNAAVLLTVRPDDMHLTEAGIPATVISATPFYAERYLLLEVEGDRERWEMKVAPELNITPGEIVNCRIMPDNLMYFDARTGQRLG